MDFLEKQRQVGAAFGAAASGGIAGLWPTRGTAAELSAAPT